MWVPVTVVGKTQIMYVYTFPEVLHTNKITQGWNMFLCKLIRKSYKVRVDIKQWITLVKIFLHFPKCRNSLSYKCRMFSRNWLQMVWNNNKYSTCCHSKTAIGQQTVWKLWKKMYENVFLASPTFSRWSLVESILLMLILVLLSTLFSCTACGGSDDCQLIVMWHG